MVRGTDQRDSGAVAKCAFEREFSVGVHLDRGRRFSRAREPAAQNCMAGTGQRVVEPVHGGFRALDLVDGIGVFLAGNLWLFLILAQVHF